MGDWLKNLVESIEPENSIDDMLMYKVEDSSLTWILSHAFQFMWERRQRNKKSTIMDYLPALRADIETLKGTRHENLATIASIYTSI